MTDYPKYASVILDLALDKTLEYGIPADFCEQVKPGMRVEVPVRGHKRGGYIYTVKDKADFPRVLPISRVISDTEFVSKELFELAIWMSKYYFAPLSQVMKIMLPASIRKEIKPKQQQYVMRAKTRKVLREYCMEIRNKYPAQAAVIDVMLKVKKGILLTELLEQTGGSNSPVHTLEKKRILAPRYHTH